MEWVPHVAALPCRLYEPWIFFPSFSQNKDSDGDKERGNPGQMMHTAEGGSCGKHRKINHGRGGGEEAWVLYSAGLCRQQQRSTARRGRRASEPPPALFQHHFVQIHPPGSDEEES